MSEAFSPIALPFRFSIVLFFHSLSEDELLACLSKPILTTLYGDWREPEQPFAFLKSLFDFLLARFSPTSPKIAYLLFSTFRVNASGEDPYVGALPLFQNFKDASADLVQHILESPLQQKLVDFFAKAPVLFSGSSDVHQVLNFFTGFLGEPVSYQQAGEEALKVFAFETIDACLTRVLALPPQEFKLEHFRTWARFSCLPDNYFTTSTLEKTTYVYTFRARLMAKGLRVSALEMRISAADELGQLCSRAREVEAKRSGFQDHWLTGEELWRLVYEEKDVFQHLFGPRTHLEILTRCSEVVRSLVSSSKMTEEIFSLILQHARGGGHESMSDAVIHLALAAVQADLAINSVQLVTFFLEFLREWVSEVSSESSLNIPPTAIRGLSDMTLMLETSHRRENHEPAVEQAIEMVVSLLRQYLMSPRVLISSAFQVEDASMQSVSPTVTPDGGQPLPRGWHEAPHISPVEEAVLTSYSMLLKEIPQSISVEVAQLSQELLGDLPEWAKLEPWSASAATDASPLVDSAMEPFFRRRLVCMYHKILSSTPPEVAAECTVQWRSDLVFRGNPGLHTLHEGPQDAAKVHRRGPIEMSERLFLLFTLFQYAGNELASERQVLAGLVVLPHAAAADDSASKNDYSKADMELVLQLLAFLATPTLSSKGPPPTVSLDDECLRALWSGLLVLLLSGSSTSAAKVILGNPPGPSLSSHSVSFIAQEDHGFDDQASLPHSLALGASTVDDEATNDRCTLNLGKALWRVFVALTKPSSTAFGKKCLCSNIPLLCYHRLILCSFSSEISSFSHLFEPVSTMDSDGASGGRRCPPSFGAHTQRVCEFSAAPVTSRYG